MASFTIAALAIGLATVVTEPAVKTAYGPLACALIGDNTRGCYAIPFARAPVGPLRWRPPARASPWTETRDATRPRPICIQGPPHARPPTGNTTSEDCLYLNVYTPRSASTDPGGYPVLVWHHGGSYSTGSAPNGSMLVEHSQDVVFVGVNYRLNVFGFLGSELLRSRDPEGSTGNYGLQDQRAAMAWVRANIASFGGDPAKITIDGCSAGAGSTANHLVNAKSWPFFDQTAGMSGMLAAWNTVPMPLAEGLFTAVMKAGRCAPGNTSCLVAMNATLLVAAASAGFDAASPAGAHWAPAVDGVDTVASPYELTARGHVHPGPVLIGTARDETCSLRGRSFSFRSSQADFQRYVNSSYGDIGISIAKIDALYGNISRPSITRPRKPVSPWWWAAIEQSSDFSFHCPSRYAAERLSAQGHGVYLFSYNVSFEMWASYSGGVQCVPHCSELGGVIFGTLPDPRTPQGRLTLAIAAYHTSFVRHGDPNLERVAGSPVWPMFATDNGPTGTRAHSAPAKPSAGGVSLAFALPAAGGIRAERGYRKAPCDYWESLPGGPDALAGQRSF